MPRPGRNFEKSKDFKGSMKRLLKSLPIALVTGKGEKSCAITLRQFNMDTCFDKVKTGNPFKNNKGRCCTPPSRPRPQPPAGRAADPRSPAA